MNIPALDLKGRDVSLEVCMDLRKKNILVALIIGAIAAGIYLLSIAKFLFPASNP